MSSLPNLNPRNPYIRLLFPIFSLGVALGSGFGYGFSQVANPRQHELPAQVEVRHLSLIQYERVQLGMTLTDVRAILGSNGTEVDRTPTTVTFVWDNLDGSKITAIFDNGKLNSKKQSRLK